MSEKEQAEYRENNNIPEKRKLPKAGEKIKEKGEELGLELSNIIESPILGEKGNREFLLRLTK